MSIVIACVIHIYVSFASGNCTNMPQLYFQLRNRTLLPRESVNITEIGQPSRYKADPGSSLVCLTTYFSTSCCRSSDGGLGTWYFPNGTEVPGHRFSDYSSFVRKRYFQEVRLSRSNGGVGPLGFYTCEVSDGRGNILRASVQITGEFSRVMSYFLWA